MIIAVIGAGDATAEIAGLAEHVGAELGRRGVTLVCGGLGGVMEAACRGAKSAGGTTIAILPGNDPRDANPWVDYPVCTGLGYARNVAVVKTGRAVIAVGGAYGTLSEIGHALGDGIPVVALKTWDLRREGLPERSLILAKDPLDAVEKALKAAHSRDGTVAEGPVN